MRPSDLPLSGATRLTGLTPGELALLLDESRDSEVAVVSIPLANATSVLGITVPAVSTLTDIARSLFPRWLPAGGSSSTLDEAASRIRARRLSDDPAIGSALSDLAATALGRPPAAGGDRPLRDRMMATCVAIRHSYAATELAIAAHVPPGCDVRATEHAAEWLADCGVAVWLHGPGAEPIDRFPTVPPAPGTRSAARPSFPPLPDREPTFPPLSGAPHPGSPAEQLLEASLRSQAWAADRRWNCRITLTGHPPVFVDVLLPGARLVIELDGDDHRTPEKYAADRRRDAALLIRGYRVVRFVNADVFTDVSAVLTIMRVLASDTVEGKPHG